MSTVRGVWQPPVATAGVEMALPHVLVALVRRWALVIFDPGQIDRLNQLAQARTRLLFVTGVVEGLQEVSRHVAHAGFGLVR